MTDQPRPSLDRWLQMTVPPEDLAELAEWLRYLIGYLEAPAPKGSADRPAVTEKLRFYAGLARRGAKGRSDRNAAAWAAQSRAAAEVVAPPQIPRASEAEEITTAQAAALTGLSAERMRQLAASGKIRARRTDRGVWLLNRADVIAWTMQHGRANGTRGSTRHEGDAAA